MRTKNVVRVQTTWLRPPHISSQHCTVSTPFFLNVVHLLRSNLWMLLSLMWYWAHIHFWCNRNSNLRRRLIQKRCYIQRNWRIVNVLHIDKKVRNILTKTCSSLLISHYIHNNYPFYSWSNILFLFLRAGRFFIRAYDYQFYFDSFLNWQVPVSLADLCFIVHFLA